MNKSAVWFKRAFAALSDKAYGVAIDIETCGLNVKDPYMLPVELGWAVIDNYKVVDHGSVLLNWRKQSLFIGHRVEEKLDTTRRQMIADGKPHHITQEMLHADGACPRDALRAFAQLINDTVGNDGVVIGFNCARFDLRVLARCFDEFADAHMNSDTEFVVRDCGMFELALLAEIPPPLGPEVLSSWYTHVHKQSGRRRWSLYDYALPMRGIEFDPTKSHAADQDARLTAELYLSQRLLGK